MKYYRWYFYGFGIFFITIFLFSVISHGILLGGDWGLPGTSIQMKNFFDSWNESWTNSGDIFGFRQVSFTTIPLKFIVGIFLFFNFSNVYFLNIFYISYFILAALTMYSLMRYFEFSRIIAGLAGIMYITMPVFFDYTIMGWQFALLAMGLFPLATKYFIKSIKENNIKYSIIVGIIYSLAMMQSQSMVWFPIIFAILGFYLVEGKNSLFRYLKSISIVFILFVALNMYWALGLIVAPDKTVSGSDIVNSSISLGTMSHFYPLNIIRLFGGLFNFQYETAVSLAHLSVLSFVIPLLALGVLFIKKNRKRNITFWLIALIPLGMYVLNFNRDILLHIPFSNVIRDFARFTVLSSFAYAVLASIFLNFLITHKKLIFRKIGYGLIFVWFLSIFPWWTGGLTDWKNGVGSDMRLRTKVFPKEYLKVENNFAKNKLDQKALYLPIGGMVSFEDDEKFKGMFKETQDIFAGYSPIPGVIGLSDRGHGYVNDFVEEIIGNNGVDFINYLKVTDVGYIVLRKNMVFKNRDKVEQVIQEALDKKMLSEYYSGKKIAVYKVTDFIPHLYVARNVIILDGEISDMKNIIIDNKRKAPTIFFKKQNKKKSKISNELNSKLLKNDNKREMLEYRKISPSKYRVVLKNVKDKFLLVFLE